MLMRLCRAFTLCVLSRFQLRCGIHTTGLSKSSYSEIDQQLPLPLLILLNFFNQANHIFLLYKASIIEGERWKFSQLELVLEVSAVFKKSAALGRLLSSSTISAALSRKKPTKLSQLYHSFPLHLGSSFGVLFFHHDFWANREHGFLLRRSCDGLDIMTYTLVFQLLPLPMTSRTIY